MTFDKALAKYYELWYRNCHNSVIYCLDKGRIKDAEAYRLKAIEYFNFINENWYDIDFYRIGDNAYYNEYATNEARRTHETRGER